jgi:hypothetical protein
VLVEAVLAESSAVKNAAAMLANVLKSWTVPQGQTTASHRRNVAQL